MKQWEKETNLSPSPVLKPLRTSNSPYQIFLLILLNKVFEFCFYFFPLSGCFSGNNDHILAIHHKRSGKPAFLYHQSQDIEKSLDIAPQKIYKHSSSETQINRNHQIVNSAFLRPAYDPSLNLLAVAGQDIEVENLPIPAANVIVVVSIALN